MKNLFLNYQSQKTEFLDNLEPDDFRNGASFNQAEEILDNVLEALYNAVLKGKDAEEFINKAMNNLFRENSLARLKAIELARSFLAGKFVSTNT